MSTTRNRAHISKLEHTLSVLQRRVAECERQHALLKARAAAVAAASATASAMLGLGAAIDAQRRSGAASGGNSSSDASGATAAGGGGACGGGANGQQSGWRAQLQELSADLAAGLPDHLRAHEGAAPPVALGWQPAAAAARAQAAAAAGDLTAAGMRRAFQEFAHTAGVLLLRVSSGAPDAEDARRRLAEAKSRLLEQGALLSLHTAAAPSGPPPGIQLLMEPVSGGAAVPKAGPEHWQYAAQRLGLDPEQEATMLQLLELWSACCAGLTQRRQELLAQCTATGAGAVDRQAALLDELVALQHRYQLSTGVFVLAAHGCLTTPEQFGSYAVAVYPWFPSLTALHPALLRLRDERAAAAASGQPSGDPGPAPGQAKAGGGPSAAAPSGSPQQAPRSSP